MPLNMAKVKSAGFTPVIVAGADLLALLRPEERPGRVGCQAVLVGVEGVLVEVGEIETRSWRKLACELGAVVDPAENFRRRSPAECLQGLLGPVGREMDAIEKSMLLDRRREHWAEMLGELGPRDVVAGAGELLGQLREMGIKVACVPSCGGTRRALEAVGIEAWFDLIAEGSLLAAADELGVRAGLCVVIERAETVLAEARGAGMRAVSVAGDPAMGYLADGNVKAIGEIRPGMLDLIALRARSAKI